MKKIARILVGVVLAIALVVVLSWGVMQLGRLYWSLLGKAQLQTTQTQLQTQTTRQTLELSGFAVCYVQLGQFNNQANATKMVQQMAAKGIKAVALRGQPYRVAVGYYGQTDAAKDAKLLLVLKGVNSLVRQEEVNGISGSIISGDGVQVKAVLVNYGAILAKIAKEFNVENSVDLNENGLANLVEEITKLQQATSVPVQTLADNSQRIIVKEMTLSLDQQGRELIGDLRSLAGHKTGDNYNKAQYTALQLLNTYWQYIDLLQVKGN